MLSRYAIVPTPFHRGTAASMHACLGGSAKRANTRIKGAGWPLSGFGRLTE